MCVVKHLGQSSPIHAFRSEMMGDADELIAGGMDKDAAWLQVIDAKLTDLRAESARIERVVADAYAKTPAGSKAAKAQAAVAPVADPAGPSDTAADLDPLDAELQDALGKLGDVLGDVFGGKLNMMPAQYGAADLLPALSKVVELLVRKGFKTFAQATTKAAQVMRANASTAPHVDAISARQWKAAYNAIADGHEGTDSEEALGALTGDDVKALVAGQAQEKAPDPKPEGPEAEAGPVVIPASEAAFAEAMSNAVKAERQRDDGDGFTAADQTRGENERYAATFGEHPNPVSLPRTSSATPKPDGVEFLTADEAATKLAEWKAEAARQGKKFAGQNGMRTVISLFDASGVLAQPWHEAGYNVVAYDLQTGTDISAFNADNLLEQHGNDEVWAILAQPPCTDFASSGAQWWKAKDADGRTEASNELVRQVLRTVELFRPPVWVMENPVGRIAKLNKLPTPTLQMDPWHYGDPYTKRTLLWGNFDPNLPTAMVEPTDGSKIHNMSSSAKYERSLTPEGFAYALFMANNSEGLSHGKRLAAEFAGIDASLFDRAMQAGTSERDIRDAIEDPYYDNDLEYVRDELIKMGATSGPETPAATTRADTQAKEATDDPTPSSDAPALDQPLDAGQQPASPAATRGTQQPRRKSRRANDRGVRDAGGLFEGLDDEGGDLGDSRGDRAVPDGSPAAVAASRERVPAPDFRPGIGGLKREGSWFKTAERNLDLIELARKIESENRLATPDEQELLSKYVGFGASEIRNALFPVAQAYQKLNAPEGSLIFPDAVHDAKWKALAVRAAALPLDWQRTILQSTQYAHYTSESIIRSVWSAVQRLGFTGGNVFEPGGGIGSFAMLMPESVYQTSKFTGIEFDGPTALIARLLSPGQNMIHDDFIKRRLPDNFFDVAVGNPPFSQTKITADPRYQKQGFMLHDYFFAKAIDKVRPGGLLAFVTSKGTMDKQTDKARRYLMAQADLVGAVRLPSTAFEDNTGTSVVTDVIFLRKRMPGEAPGGEPWSDVMTVETKDGPVVVNQYYANNPHMVLGQNRISGFTDDQGRRINSNGMGGAKYTVVSYDTAEELDAKFAAAVERLPANVYSAQTMETVALRKEVAKMDFDPKIKREGVVYVGKDGEVLRVEDGVGKPLGDAVKLSAKDKAWLSDYVTVRDLVKEAQLAQVTDGAWEAALKKLNKAYDAFVKKNGPINAFRVQVRKSTDEEGNPVETPTRVFTNRRLFREDYDSALMTQMETIDEDGQVKKAPFLLGRTIGKPTTRQIKSIGDALAVSLDALGHLDVADVADRLHISRDEAIEALGSQVYRAPGGDWQLADEYLSGNVVDKLEEATLAARLDSSLQRNVEALKAVQPEKLGPSQISVKLGAPWVDVKHVQAFAAEIEAGDVSFDAKTETWQVEGGNLRSQRRAGAEYGTAARSPSELLEAVLNSRTIKVMTKTAEKKDVVDTDATTAANEAAKKMREKFKTWVWTDSERAADLVEAYNKQYNNLAPRMFDGSHLTLPGVSLRYKLHPHQLRAIWRQIQTGSTYLAHAVGAGKTIEMIAGGMEQKRLGLIRKPIYVVPNHMLEQFSNEFMELYPLANIMVADDQNFSKERRKAFVAAATLNAPDAIVITHDAFQRIGVKAETINPIRDEILADLEDELTSVAKDAGARVRRGQLEQQIEAVNQRFDSILAAGKKDGVIDFEDMGVDMIFADEAHVYRKLDFHSAQSIKGIDPNGSRRALDMYVKTRHLDRLRPGRAMVFASGTAVTNTMGELYTIMRFFDPATLDAGGISTFDSWARMFGEVAAALEPNAAGKYEMVERFAKFDNVPELMARVRMFMDVLQSDQLGAIVKRPETRGGKPNLNLVAPSQAMKDYQELVLQPRLEKSRKWKPSKDEPNNPDPVIAIISDGRLAATDPRFIPGGRLQPGETTKIDEAAGKIAAEYKATANNVYVDREGKPMAAKGGTQIVFYNVGFGAASSARRGFDSRGTFTKAIVAGGVKREHIAWFDDADTDAKKEAVFKGMRNGTFRVLIGSAKKMGTGVNVQNRLTTLHYMDPPWFPADVEQPRGRIIRQGNQNPIAGEEWYATKGGYDSTMWQMVGRKQRFIDQAFRGDKNLRSMEDLGEASLYEQAAAMASGDPRALLLAGLRQDTERLERLHAAHASEQINARHAMRSAEWAIESASKRVATYEAAFKALGSSYFTFTAGTVSGATYSKQTDFGQALKDAFNKGAAAAVLEPNRVEQQLGTIGNGLAITMHAGFQYVKEGEGKDSSMVQVPNGRHQLTVTAGPHTVDVGEEVAGMGSDVDALGLARKVVNALNGIEADLRRARADVTTNTNDVTRLRKKVGAPFEHQADMLEKWAALKALEEELRLEGLAVAQAVPADEQGEASGEATGEDEGTPPAFSRSTSVAPPRVTVEKDESGAAVYIGDKVRLEFPQVTERLEVIEQAGEQVVNYPIMAATGFEVLGYVELLVKDGQVRALLDIEVDKAGRKSGVARSAIELLLAASPSSDITISNVVPEARGFWEKMGIPQQNVEGAYDANLNWKTYAAAQNTGTESRLAGTSEAARGRSDASAKGEVGGARQQAQGASQGRPGRRESVEKLVGQLKARWKNAPDVVVLASMDDPRVPAAVRNANRTQLSQGAEGSPEGFFHDGKVYLVADELGGDADVVRVLFHEALGHFGLRGTFGVELSSILDRLAVLNAGKVRAKARQYGLDYDKLSDRRIAAEEVLAEMAQRSPDIGWAKKAVAAIRTWLRQHVPGFRQMALSDAEIVRSYLLPARAFVLRGGASGDAGGVSFSRAEAKTHSAAFKRWFGDSKVVDAEGKPLVVYHGTRVQPDTDKVKGMGDIREFDRMFTTKFRRPSIDTVGSWFSSNPGDGGAEMYAGTGQGSAIYPVYLSIKNPQVTTFHLMARRARLLHNGKDDGRMIGAEEVAAYRKWLADMGKDGIKIEASGNDGSTEFDKQDAWIALEPEQIKSAIGNNGQFDQENPDIRFSRSTLADAVTNFSQAGARNAFLDAVTSHGSTNFWGRTVGTQYHKAQTHPTTFGRVFDSVQDYIKDTSVFANKSADLAPSLLPKMDTWRDVAKGGLLRHGADPKDAAKAGDAIFQGTLGEQVYDDATLASKFGLNTLQIGLYREFRAAVDASLDGLGKTEMLRMAGEGAASLRAKVLDAETAEEAAQLMVAVIDDEVANGVIYPADAAASIKAKADQIRKLKAKGYAPLSRFGKHTLTVIDQDGDVAYFGMYESVRDANKEARLLKADPDFAGMKFSQGVMSEQGHKLFGGLSLDSLELFAQTIDQQRNPVYQEYLKVAVANRSALKRMITRKGIAGYSTDAARVLASFVTSNARMSAGHLHLSDAKKAAEAIPKEQGDLRDEAIKLVDYVTEPAEEAAAVRGLLFTSFIGGSVASALVNMTQPITMTLPYLTQHGGAAKAGKRLAAAMAMVASGKGMDAELVEALNRAEADGIVSPQEIHHLQGAAMDSLGNKYPALKKAAFIWGSMFGLAEQFNRRVSFVAAYKTAQQEGIANPFAFAEKAVIETQGLYNKGNKAAWARGAVGATVMTFKQFSTHYLEFLVRMWKSGPEGKKAVAVALALLILMGGAGGLPFADDLDDLIDTLGQAMGHDTNSKRWKRQFVARTLGLGDEAADVATRGLTALPGFPLDLSLRMGMGNLLPATGLFLRSNTDTARQLLEVAGAAGGLAANVKDGVAKALGGDVGGGAMKAMPMAVQNMLKAMEMAQTGEYRNTKGAKVMDVDATDVAMKFIGFQPAEVARESGRVGEAMRSIQLARNVESEIAGRWAQAMVDQDPKGVAEARRSLADWNAANPTAQIKITIPQVLARVKALRSSRADRTVKAAPKEMRGTVKESLS